MKRRRIGGMSPEAGRTFQKGTSRTPLRLGGLLGTNGKLPFAVQAWFVVLLHVAIVVGAHFVWPQAHWGGLPVAFALLPYTVMATRGALRFYTQEQPDSVLAFSLEDVNVHANLPRELGRGIFALFTGRRTDLNWRPFPPGPPNWWVYRTICIFVPSVLLTLIGLITAAVIFQEGNERLGWTVGFAVFGVSCVVFFAIGVIGIVGRPIFLMPKLIRDAHAAGKYHPGGGVFAAPDGQIAGVGTVGPTADLGLGAVDGANTAQPDDGARYGKRPRQRLQRRPRQRSRKGRA